MANLVQSLILVLLFANLLKADFSDGKYAGEFISYNVDARTMGTGNLLITSPYEAAAVYYNPALINYDSKLNSAIFSHSERFSGTVVQDFLAGSINIKGRKVGLALVRIGVDDIPITGELIDGNRPDILKKVGNNEIALFAGTGFGSKIEGLRYGLSAKVLYKSFEEESAFGAGFDLSCLYQPVKNFKFAVKLQDLTTSVLSWTTGTYEYIKPALSLQGEYSFISDYLLTDFTLFLGNRIGSEGYQKEAFASLSIFDLELNLGGEFYINKLFRLRLGTQNLDRYFGGAGFNFEQIGLGLDYAFSPDYEDLGDTHKISLVYSWE